MRNGMLKKEGFAVWTRVPGTPFTLPGSLTVKERLPGMVDWAPREVVTRVAKGLRSGDDGPVELAEAEAQRGLPQHAGVGAVAGTTLGSLLGRLFGGQAAIKPFQEIGQRGIGSSTLRQLKNLPAAMKLLPILGALGGAGVGAKVWERGQEGRRQQALDVSKGLLAERILQSQAIQEALRSNNPYTAPLLRGIPITSASAPVPHVMRYGHIGV